MQPTGMGNPAPVLARPRHAGKRAAHRPRRGASEPDRPRRGRQAARRDVLRRGARRRARRANTTCSFRRKSTPGRGAPAWKLELQAMEPLDARARISRRNAAKWDALVFRFLTEMLYNREIDSSRGGRANAADVRALLAASPQGTLLAAADLRGRRCFCWTCWRRNRRCALIWTIGAYPQDARAFNAMCLLPAGAPPRNYRRVIWAGRCAGCAAMRMVCGTSGRGRPARRLSRPARHPSPPRGVRRAGGAVPPGGRGVRPDRSWARARRCWRLRTCALMETDESGARLLPMEKRDPMDSAVVQMLLRLRAEGR